MHVWQKTISVTAPIDHQLILVTNDFIIIKYSFHFVYMKMTNKHLSYMYNLR